MNLIKKCDCVTAFALQWSHRKTYYWLKLHFIAERNSQFQTHGKFMSEYLTVSQFQYKKKKLFKDIWHSITKLTLYMLVIALKDDRYLYIK